MNASTLKTIRKKLLTWYRKGTRSGLPWRKTRNPYRIWISEAMLQQTRVETVIPYYHRFLKRFPTVQALGTAPITQVLESWSGLGYYSRAKNLHAASREILKRYSGKIPSQVEELLTLPGVGRYTAGAIASIAFGKPAPILDGNVIRVLSRFFGITQNPQNPKTQRRLWALAEILVPKESPGDFNQALMDLGATVCTPRHPECPLCPLKRTCQAYKKGWQEKIPPPRRAVHRKRIRYVCGILEKNGSVLLARRPLSGLLPGLWEFPGGQIGLRDAASRGLTKLLSDRLGIQAQPRTALAQVRQTLTHRELEIHPFSCQWQGSISAPRWYAQTRWVSKKSLKRTPFTAGMAQVAKQLW